MGASISALLINIVVAAVILFGGTWLANKARPHVRGMLVNRNLDPMLATFITSIAHITAIIFIIIAALSELGIQTTSLIAIVGAAGLAVALSLQSSLSSFAAGVMIIAFRPFKVGDYIEAGGTAGIVEEIQIFSTRMRTGDNKAVIVPNSGIINGNIINYSDKDTRRVDMVFGISYNDDIGMAKKILDDVLKQDERILEDPEPTIAVSQLGDSSVNLIVRPWVKTDDYWAVLWDLTETIKLRFDKEGINIPYPQRDVHLHQVA
ncbi:MAG: mechanosensitive ion channel domain-containing protein [Gammaproteobacteria bacterium]